MSPVEQRAQALQQTFEHIARTRMAGLPLAHPRLAVGCVGFHAEADGTFALGVLVTPWCMNLVRLPLHEGVAVLAAGHRGTRDIGTRCFDFVGACEADIGTFESASLFSPMFEFVDQAAAVATAEQVLQALGIRADAVPTQEHLARRGFLFGRSTGAAA